MESAVRRLDTLSPRAETPRTLRKCSHQPNDLASIRLFGRDVVAFERKLLEHTK